MLPQHDWDTHYMSEAYLWARKSKDRRTQVGAVIVGEDNDDRTRGYNGPLRGLDDSADYVYEKPIGGGPSPFMAHAEQNAIVNSSRNGISVKGCTIYVTLFPCDNCARMIVNSGIREVVLHAQSPGKLNERQQAALEILRTAGIEIRWWSGRPLIEQILYDGEIINTGDDNAHR